MRYAILLLLSGLLAAVAGCGATATPPENSPDATETAAHFSLPAPADLAHLTQAAGVNEVETGGSFVMAYNRHIDGEGTTAIFEPDFPLDNQGPYDLAYAAYTFEVDPPYGFMRLDLDWETAPQWYWLGFPNYEHNRWDWYEAETHSLDLPASLAPYLDHEIMQVMVAVVGVDQAQLNTLTLVADSGSGLDNLFFLHHSVGNGVVEEGNVRFYIDQYNTAHGTDFEFWDHGYREEGLRGPDGLYTGTDYGWHTDYTDPPDLHDLWTSADPDWAELRETILDNHQVIAFKSCYPASDIADAAELLQRQEWYLDMRDFFDTRTDRLFVVITTPPLEPGATSPENAARARQFAEWLKDGDYLNGHPNIVCFDIFDLLAAPAGSGAEANMLRAEYRSGDASHPNTAGYQAVAPVFAEFLCDSAAAF